MKLFLGLMLSLSMLVLMSAMSFQREFITLPDKENTENGKVEGSGFMKAGSAPLQADNGIRWYLEDSTTHSLVGIHLGNNLFLGGDRNEDFVARRDKLLSNSQASLDGDIDDVLIARAVLRPDEFMN